MPASTQKSQNKKETANTKATTAEITKSQNTSCSNNDDVTSNNSKKPEKSKN